MGGYSVTYHVFTFILTWIASDLFEFAYHLLGHSDIKWEKYLFILFMMGIANVYFSYSELQGWEVIKSACDVYSARLTSGALFINLDLHQIKSSINW